MSREGRSWAGVSNEEEQAMSIGAVMQDARPTFTPIQQRIIDLLSDGMPHSREAILECLQDELVNNQQAHKMHIMAIRYKLRPRGQDIICEYVRRRPFYRHVRLLASSYDGQQ